MSDSVYEWFAGLATVSGLMYFLAGFGFAYATHCIRAKMRHKKVHIPWHIAGITIGIAAIIIVTIQSQVAYTTAKETALESQECQKQFFSALKARSRITSENDEVSQEQRLIVFNWIHDLIFPPAPFNTMNTNDPRRQDYGITRTIETERAFQKSLDHQDALQRERDKHPLPDPTCGAE